MLNYTVTNVHDMHSKNGIFNSRCPKLNPAETRWGGRNKVQNNKCMRMNAYVSTVSKCHCPSPGLLLATFSDSKATTD